MCVTTASRLNNFFTKLSNTQPQIGNSLNDTVITMCTQYPGSAPAVGPLLVTCQPGIGKFRYVIIQGQADALGLMEVQIFACKQLTV